MTQKNLEIRLELSLPGESYPFSKCIFPPASYEELVSKVTTFAQKHNVKFNGSPVINYFRAGSICEIEDNDDIQLAISTAKDVLVLRIQNA